MRTTTGSATWARPDPLRKRRGARTPDQPAGQPRHRAVASPGLARSRGGPRPLAAMTAGPTRGEQRPLAEMTATRGRPPRRGAPPAPARRTRPGRTRPGRSRRGRLRLGTCRPWTRRAGMRRPGTCRPGTCRAGMRRFEMSRAGMKAVEPTRARVPPRRRRPIPAWSGHGRPCLPVPRRRFGPSPRPGASGRPDLTTQPSLMSCRRARAQGVRRSLPVRVCPDRSGRQTSAGQRGWMRPPCATRGLPGCGLTTRASPASDRRSSQPGFGPRARQPRRGPPGQRLTLRKRTRRRAGGPSARRQTPSHLGWPARQHAAWLTLAMRGPHCPFPAWLSRWPPAVR